MTPLGNRVYRAVDGHGRAWALKEFNLYNDAAARALWRHMGVLDDLQHPRLARVCAVFEDRGSAFVQMPWYAGGNVAEWLRATPASARRPEQCKQMLLDAAEAVEHLHRHGHTHSDIKPSNLFLTGSGRVVLGDFDGVARAEATLTRSLQGGTLGFIAPELLSGAVRQYTAACDVYALGVVAREVLGGVELGDQEAEAGVLRRLLERMAHTDPQQRPSAADVCGHPFLRPSSAAPGDLRHCSTCWDTKHKSAGAECRGGGAAAQGPHFTCAACLALYVRSLAAPGDTAQQIALAEQGGRLACTGHGCQGHLPPETVARHLAGEAAAQYQQALRRGVEGWVSMQLRGGYEARIQQLQEQLQHAQLSACEARAAQVEKHAIEDILTLQCPRCTAAIIDFDGCFALTCHRCAAGLCGWCLADCGRDAHTHVQTCKWSRRPGALYADTHLFTEAANSRRKDAIARCLRGLESGELRGLVRDRLRPHLRDLGIEGALDGNVTERSP